MQLNAKDVSYLRRESRRPTPFDQVIMDRYPKVDLFIVRDFDPVRETSRTRSACFDVKGQRPPVEEGDLYVVQTNVADLINGRTFDSGVRRTLTQDERVEVYGLLQESL